MKAPQITFLLIALTSTAALADSLDMSVSINASTFLESKRFIQYLNDQGFVANGPTVSVYHTIVNTDAAFSGNRTTPDSGSIESSNGPETPSCYTGRLTAQATQNGIQSAASSEQLCYQGPPPPQDINPYWDPCGPCSPIVFNFEEGTYRLTGANNPVLFDIAGSGTAELLGWTVGGGQEAFLGLDRNQNGTIDDGTELFGDATPLSSGGRAPNGFVALAEYDANGDGVINAKDPIWNALVLWFDRNHDGISQPEELLPIRSSTITAIGLDHHWSGRRDKYGNTSATRDSFTKANGRERSTTYSS